MRKKIKNQKLKIKIYVCLLFTVHCLLPPRASLAEGGLAVSFAETPSRIISLAPGITEILFAAGLGERIVGVTTFCDYPEEAKTKTKVGGMSNPSLEAVVSLRPDVVIMTIDGNPKEFTQRLHSMNIETHIFESLTLPELPMGIRKIGDALGEKKRFDTLAADVEKALERFKKRETGSSKRVLFIIWPEPLIVAGPRTAIDDSITLLGGVNIAGKAKSRYPKYSIEEIFRQTPDVIFIGKGMGREHENLEKISIKLLKRLSNVKAVKEGKVFFVSDSLYRLGPRVVQGIEELAKHLEE
jgi:iron complex transport system substrate-binding protein